MLYYHTLTFASGAKFEKFIAFCRTLNNTVFCIFFVVENFPILVNISPPHLLLPILIVTFSVSRVQFHHESWNWVHQHYVIIGYVIIILFIEVLRNALWQCVTRAGSSVTVEQLLVDKWGRMKKNEVYWGIFHFA